MSNISLKADIHPNAKIGNNCTIYPFVYIEDNVTIGDNCVIYPFVSIMNGTIIGSGNTIYQSSVIGAIPQDFRFKGDSSKVIIGDNNIIRENVVINRATFSNGVTQLGNNNCLMEGAHISHDTKVKDHCVFGYGTKIAGDCEIGDGVIFSSSVIENAGTRVGKYSILQAGATFSKDIPPYSIVTKNGEYGGVNEPICKKYGIDNNIIKHIANAYRLIFHGQTSLLDAINQIKEQVPDDEEIREIISFLETNTKGLIGKM